VTECDAPHLKLISSFSTIFFINIFIESYTKNNIERVKKESEIKNVFNKGFTGSNGRILNKKSTGIGLYLCKKLCDILGVSLNDFFKDDKIKKLEFFL